MEAKTFGPCSDHGCVFGHRGGMGTNGGCHCLDDLRFQKLSQMEVHNLSRAIRDARERAEAPKVIDQYAAGRNAGMEEAAVAVNDCPTGDCEGIIRALKSKEVAASEEMADRIACAAALNPKPSAGAEAARLGRTLYADEMWQRAIDWMEHRITPKPSAVEVAREKIINCATDWYCHGEENVRGPALYRAIENYIEILSEAEAGGGTMSERDVDRIESLLDREHTSVANIRQRYGRDVVRDIIRKTIHALAEAPKPSAGDGAGCPAELEAYEVRRAKMANWAGRIEDVAAAIRDLIATEAEAGEVTDG